MDEKKNNLILTEEEINIMFKSTYDLPSTMKGAMANAVAIWDVMGISEEEFNEMRNKKAPVESSEK